MKTRRLISGGAVAATLALVTAGGVIPTVAQASPARGHAGPAVTHYTATRGMARLLPRTSRPANPAPVRVFPKGARRLGSDRFSAAEAVPRSPAATGAAAAKPAWSPVVNFDGVGSRDSQVTNFNAKFEPPDQGLCEGNGFVLEPVNSAYRIFRTNGTSIRGPFNVNDLFNVGGKEFTSDPRCWFDRSTQTWFATIVFLNDTFTASSELIAVRHAPDPLGLWNEYSIDTTDASRGNGCPCFGDQPRIGIDQTNLYITVDNFSIQGPQFFGSQLYALDKADLVAGKPLTHFVRFDGLTPGGEQEHTVAPQPALSTGKPNAEYLLGALDPNGQGDNRISVWAMTNRGQVGKGGFPTLTSTVINSEAYADPPPAPQRQVSSTLDSGDDRMQSTQFVGGSVWGELTTAVQPAGDSQVRAGGAWFQVRPRLGPSGIAGASIVRQGYIAAKGQYAIYPAVQPDAAGNAAAVFTLTSPNRFPSAAFATLKAGARNFGPPVVAAAGTGPYDTAATRWGDYSFAVPNDGSDAAWLATEYIPPRSSQTSTRHRNWGTRVFEVPLP